MSEKRIGMTGCSGSGKTAVAKALISSMGLMLNPVGARSVAKSMGFASPYEVDRAGMRTAFQTRLLDDKVEWESDRREFVTDRTTVDNLTYTAMHCPESIDERMLDKTVQGMNNYTHVVYCPFDVFCEPAGDPSRIGSLIYHRIYDMVLEAFLRRMLPAHVHFCKIPMRDLEKRLVFVAEFIDPGAA